MLRRAAERRDADHEETLRELDDEGVSLDPAAPGQHRHGDVENAAATRRRPRPPAPAPGSGRADPSSGSSVPGLSGSRSGSPSTGPAGRSARSRQPRPGAPRAVPGARHRRPRVRRGQRARGRRRARDPRRPRRRDRRVAQTLRLYAGQAMIHTSGVLGAEALRAGDGRRDPGRGVPPAGRVRRPRPGACRPARRDRRDRGRRRAGGAPRRDGGGDRRRPRPAARGLKAAYHAAAVLAAGGTVALLDTIREIAGLMGLDEAGALRSTCRCSSRPLPTPAPSGSPRRSRARRSAATSGTIGAHLEALRRAPRGPSPVYRALLGARSRSPGNGARCHRSLRRRLEPHLQAVLTR